MFQDTFQLAENKLIMLYIINKIKFPLTKNQLTEIILENNLMNYFVLQQYISELISSDILKYIADDDKHRISITDKGIKVLSLFENRIKSDKILNIDEFLEHNIDSIKKEITITADYTIEPKNNYIVNLRAVENDRILIDLKVNVANNKQARELCAKWKNGSPEIYNKIINLLIGDN